MLFNLIMGFDVSHNEILGACSPLGLRLGWDSLAVRRAAHHAEHDSKEEVALTSTRCVFSVQDVHLFSFSLN